jgi:hypothetical protein
VRKKNTIMVQWIMPKHIKCEPLRAVLCKNLKFLKDDSVWGNRFHRLFCVMILFLSGGNEINKIFTFLYSVAMETENPNLVAQNPHNWSFSCLYFRKARLNTAQMPT